MITHTWIAARDSALTCPDCDGELQPRDGGGEVVELACSCCEYTDEITTQEARRVLVEPVIRLF